VLGLVHVSEMDQEPEVGQMVQVRVLNVNIMEGKLGLSMLDPGNSKSNVDLSLFQDVSPSEWLPGQVTRVLDCGVIVAVQLPSVGCEAEGLVHVNEMGDETELWEGQDVQVRLLNVNLASNRLSLSMKEEGESEGLPAADVTPFVGLSSSQWLEGRVESITPYGAFVAVRPSDDTLEVTGLVHISEMGSVFVREVGEVVQKGQTVRVRVLKADVEAGKLALSMREEYDEAREAEEEGPPADLSLFASLDKSVVLTGRVKRVASFGAFVAVRPPSGEGVAVGQVMKRDMVRYAPELRPGDQVPVRLRSVDVDAGRLSLTMKASLAVFEGADSSQWLDGRVLDTTRFGAFVAVRPAMDEGLEAEGLVHIGEMDGSDPEKDIEIGQKVKVRVIKVEVEEGRLSLSMKQPSSKLTPGDALKSFERVESSEWLEARVISASSFGVLVTVRVPERDVEVRGLVHISEMPDHFQMRSGESVLVRVVGIDFDLGRLRLSMLEPEASVPARPRADLSLFEDLKASEILKGRVTSIHPFGVFVAVRPPSGEDVEAEGLLHVSKLTDSFVKDPGEVVQPGQDIDVNVLSVDVSAGRLVLAMAGELSSGRRNLQPFEGIDSNLWLQGEVVGLTSFGAFVAVAPPGGERLDGLVHASELVARELQVGQEVQVRVVNVDVAGDRLSLSMRDATVEDASDPVSVDSSRWFMGKVASFTDEGAWVEADTPGEEPMEGFLSNAEIGEGILDPAEVLEMGQELRVRAVAVDSTSGKLVLTMSETSAS